MMMYKEHVKEMLKKYPGKLENEIKDGTPHFRKGDIEVVVSYLGNGYIHRGKVMVHIPELYKKIFNENPLWSEVARQIGRKQEVDVVPPGNAESCIYYSNFNSDFSPDTSCLKKAIENTRSASEDFKRKINAEIKRLIG
jgi:hypothetical protein